MPPDNSFAQILAALEGHPPQPAPANPPAPPRDSLQLSVQAAKAKSGPAAHNTPEERRPAKPVCDWQGNRILISREGNELASSLEQSTAWETARENPQANRQCGQNRK